MRRLKCCQRIDALGDWLEYVKARAGLCSLLFVSAEKMPLTGKVTKDQRFIHLDSGTKWADLLRPMITTVATRLRTSSFS